MKILLQEQRDAPVDVQVGFQCYEDAPQELRSRLWMALLQHPELVERYHAVERAGCQEGGGDGDWRGGVGLNTEQEEEEKEEENRGEDASADTNQNNNKDNSTSTEQPPTTNTNDDGDVIKRPENKEEQRMEKEENAEGWEVVGDRGAQRWREGSLLLAGGSLHRSEPWTPGKESYRQELMAAMASIPWPLPTDQDPESRFATLLQISIGQEEVDDVISRDIHRTFPEYPLFGFEQGQQALFRVLKAYSLHDLETGYCQGMAFVAGLVLFFVPEEAAFQIFCRLLASSGPNLRRHYLPGLRGLKVELKVFDILLQRYLPHLYAHLESHGAVPVLYASQWFLSAFSCPFPVGFACRLVDVMLVENDDAVLMKTALAVMASSEPELLMQEDFEELLTYLKVEPVQWDVHRLRKVLNSAIHGSPLTTEELRGVRAAAEGEDNLLGVMSAGDGSVGGGSPVKKKTSPLSKKPPPPLPEQQQQHAASDVDSAQGSGGDTNGGLTPEDRLLAEQQVELENAYVQMVLDLDNLWSGTERIEGTASRKLEYGGSSTDQETTTREETTTTSLS